MIFLKKYLLRCNIILLGILFLIELFYAGFRTGIGFGIRYALQSMEYYDFRIEEFFTPAIYLLFLCLSFHAFRWNEYLKPKPCVFLGSIVFILSALSWIVSLIFHARNQLVVYIPVLEVWVYPAINLLFSINILVNCIRCALQVWREKQQHKTETA